MNTKLKNIHADHPDGYLRASFGMKLRQFMLQANAIGHVEHRAGDQMYVDFAGDRLEIVDEATAEVRKVEVFVAILPCSHYTYCEAVWSQKKEDLIKACENAIRFYGGAPYAIVPDNLKSAVTRSDRNEPVINSDFEAFAEHYGCAVVPARVRHPRDKALVENAVKLMYRSVYVDLEGMVFHDLESLNGAILGSMEKFNARNLTRRRESRRQLFDTVERDSLRPLPTDRYQIRQRAIATVQRNSYVTLNKHHYSVPYSMWANAWRWYTTTIRSTSSMASPMSQRITATTLRTSTRQSRPTICRGAREAARVTCRNSFPAPP